MAEAALSLIGGASSDEVKLCNFATALGVATVGAQSCVQRDLAGLLRPDRVDRGLHGARALGRVLRAVARASTGAWGRVRVDAEHDAVR